MTVVIKKYNSKDKDIWNEFVKKSKNSIFMFERGFMDYHSDRFIDFSFMFYEKDKLIALLPATLHDSEVRSHGGLTYGGFIIDNSMKQVKMIECFEVLIKYLKEHKINNIVYKTMPYIFYKQPSCEDLYPLLMNKFVLCRRDISTTVNLKQPLKMRKGRKAQIARAKREGIIIEESNDFEPFIELENKILMEFHNTKAVHTAEELKLLKSRFPEGIQLWIAKYNGKMIAGTLLFVYDNVVHTQYMAADEKAREIGGLDLLIKTLMDKFSQDKTYFDFGISTEDSGNVLNTELISQKEGFGGRSITHDFYELIL